MEGTGLHYIGNVAQYIFYDIPPYPQISWYVVKDRSQCKTLQPLERTMSYIGTLRRYLLIHRQEVWRYIKQIKICLPADVCTYYFSGNIP